MPAPKPLKILARTIAALLLVVCGWLAHGWYARLQQPGEQRRVKQTGFRYTSPLLDVELPEGYNVHSEPIPFKYKLVAYADQARRSGRVADVSIYYRDLLDGPWFGVNEKVKYNAASLMKVPVMIAWLKRAERDPAVLGRRLRFEAAGYPGGPQSIPPSETLADGGSYTVDELLHYMLNYSDNRAMWLLYNSLPADELNYVLDSMDVTNDPSDDNNTLTAHGYSGFFRILYNASFLNREMSEKALQYLALQDFPQGIAAGVPTGIPVAAKFGEFAEGRQGEVKLLHEFGIVYHPNGPYILGVMTRGGDLAVQAEVIKEVSALVYQEINHSSRPRAR